MTATSPTPHLRRGFGTREALALNISNMVGVGPFLTIPLMIASMGGPQAILGWIAGAALAICDGLVWSELGAALPGSGGSYHFLREVYGRESWGRLLAFLFIWQFVLSGPLEIASGMIGFAQYTGFLWPGMGAWSARFLAAGVGALALALLYRRNASLGKITITIGIGTVLTMAAILVLGLPHVQFAQAFAFSPAAWNFDRGFFYGLGSATLIAMYNYMGYYDVCYIGDEVRNPGRAIPRSILGAIAICVAGYIAIYVVLLGVVPWRQAEGSAFIVSSFMARLYGHTAAVAITLLVLWTAFGSVFALLFGYSRIPYAAAVDGTFFRVFGRLHPRKEFPHVSLLTLGGVAMVAAFFPLGAVINALITTRLLVQFMGQAAAIPLLRRRWPQAQRPYRMWLYPLPALAAFAGWGLVFVSSGGGYIALGLMTLAVGTGVYFWRARRAGYWPFVMKSDGMTPTVTAS